MADLVAQNRIDFRHRRVDSLLLGILRLIDHAFDQQIAMTELDELLAHLLGWNGKIHEARRNRAFRHVRMVGAETVRHLRQCDPASLLDGLDAERAVAVPAGQHDAGGHLAGVDRKRTEENIDGLSLAPTGMLPNQQTALFHGQGGATGQHEHTIGLDLDVVSYRRHRHRRKTAHNFLEQAFTLRAEMGDNDDRKTGIGRKPAEKALQRLDATGRGANTDDGKSRMIHWTSIFTLEVLV